MNQRFIVHNRATAKVTTEKDRDEAGPTKVLDIKSFRKKGHISQATLFPDISKTDAMQTAIKPVAAVLNENYKNQLATNEYLIILHPHEELRNRIQQIKKDFSEAFQAPGAVGGKPQVTLVRFTQLALMEERIVQRLRTIAMGFCPFKVELKDFGSFPTHTIFINVLSKLPVRKLVTEIKDVQRLMKLDKDHKPHFIDDPYITIARKLLPFQYEKGWLEYSHKSFTGRFIADGMLLLKRRTGAAGGAWQIVERMAFQNLPVATRQGELFM